MADARALESVLTNLVQNAVIHGHATQVDIQVQPNAGRLSVAVIDNGRGFEGDLGQLGELFVRPARSSGSGVGLYIVRRLLTAMNGTITFRNGEAGGLVALLELPEGTHTSGVHTDEHARGVRTEEHPGSVCTNYEAPVA